MLASQYFMFAAFGVLLAAAILSRKQMARNPWLKDLFASLLLQAACAIGISFSMENLGISLILALAILASVAWMVFVIPKVRKGASRPALAA